MLEIFISVLTESAYINDKEIASIFVQVYFSKVLIVA